MAFGNEGFNLDPPRCDQANGEMAGFPNERTGVDPRHLKKGNVLWVDSHADSQSLANLGYKLEPDGAFRFDGDNSFWSGKGQDVPWLPGYRF